MVNPKASAINIASAITLCKRFAKEALLLATSKQSGKKRLLDFLQIKLPTNLSLG